MLACIGNTNAISLNGFQVFFIFMRNSSRLSSPLSLNFVLRELSIEVK